MTTVPDWNAYAKDIYQAYGKVTDYKNYQGLPMPEWGALSDKIKEAWIAACKRAHNQANMALLDRISEAMG